MKQRNSNRSPKPLRSLRERAEEMMRTRPADHPTLATEDVQALVHELSVHQTELEVQNEELRQAQVELAQARDQYSDLYEFAPFGYLTLNQNGRILEANLTAATMIGIERTVLLKTYLSKFLTRESADEFHLHRQQVFDSNTKKTCEIELNTAGEIPSIIRLESIAFGPESERCCRTAMIDITYRKAAEKIIRESEARLRQLNETLERRVSEQTREVRLLAESISHLGEGVLITEDEMDWPGPRIVFVNQAMCRISGYEAHELIGQSPRILQGDDTERATLDRIKADLHAGSSCMAELVNYRKDGTAYHAELFITPLFDDKGQRTNFVSIHRDITERKQAEEALRQSHELLEQRVKERTFALEEANKACESANAVKTRFLTAASHDLRQPLQSVELYLSVLARRLGRAEDHELCDKISVALKSIHELLDTLLDISRFEAGQILPVKRNFAVRNLLAWILAANQQQAEAKGLEFGCADTDCIGYSDPALLERVIQNFVANAIRYTDTGRIAVDCRQLEQSVTISVSDTGIGIARESMDSIFEEYCQLGNPMRDRRKGLGLGLSIVRHIARLLDHRIEVHSSPGEGSIFSVEVPLGNAVAPIAESCIPEGRLPTAGRAPLVLIIDDEPAILDAVTILLKSADIQVSTASDGREALHAIIAAGLRPDLVICDYRLPENSGVEVIHGIREALSEDLPAVLLTGDTSIQEIGAENPVNCTIVHKPIETDRLITLIEELTSARSA